VPPLSRSKVYEVDKEGYKLTTYQPFDQGIKHSIAFEQQRRAQINTLYVDNKHYNQWSNVTRPGEFGHPFIWTMGSLKAELKWDQDKGKEVLLLNGTNYHDLPWIEENFSMDDITPLEYKATLEINGKQVTYSFDPWEWSAAVFKHKVMDVVGTNPLNSVEYKAYHSTVVTNEVLDFMGSLKTTAEGIHKIDLKFGP